MTDKKSRRVVIINNIKSDTIDQAIFILKSDKNQAVTPRVENSVAYEAQNIINNYIRRVEGFKEGSVYPPSPKTLQGSGKRGARFRRAAMIAAFSASAVLFLSMIFYSYFNM